METSTESKENLIEIKDHLVKSHLNEVVRGTVEETLNGLLDAEADAICKAQRYERNPDRVDSRAGHYTRSLMTAAGKMEVKVPKLRKLPFESAIIQRYQRREISVEEALVEMYLAGVSVRRVEDVTQALWGETVAPASLSRLNQKIYGRIEEWRNRPIEGSHPYVFLDGIFLKMSWGGEVRNVAILVAIGVRGDGFREVLGVMEGLREDGDSWKKFLRHLKDRGLKDVQLVTSDTCLGLVESLPLFLPDVLWQRCMVHFYRNVFNETPWEKMKEVAAMLKAIHAQENRAEAEKKAATVVTRLREMKLTKAAKVVEDGIGETLTYFAFPQEHWRRIRTNNPMERIMKEIRRRTRVVGAFPDVKSALMLVAARLRHVAQTKWGTRKYLDMDRLKETTHAEQIA